MNKEKKLTAIVVDAEMVSALKFRDLCNLSIEKEIDFEEVFLSTGIVEKHLQEHDIDVVFVSSDLKSDNPYEMIEKLKLICKSKFVLFGENIDAIQAIRTPIFDYLQTPILDADVKQFLIRLYKHKIKESTYSLDFVSNKTLVVNRHEKAIFLDIDSIVRFEAQGSYTDIYLDNGNRISSTKNINYYEPFLVKHGFYKIHRSHMVRMSKIKEILKDEGDGIIVLNNGSKINISRSKKNEFLRYMLHSV